MPFCPKCEAEYVDDITTCFDCQVDLVASLPINMGEEQQEKVDWVKLKPLPGTVYAEMLKDIFKNESIPCIVQKGFEGAAYGASSSGLAGVETTILVPKAYFAQAEKIYAEIVDKE